MNKSIHIDKPEIMFLLGAGCSVPAGIPAMIRFTKDYAEYVQTNLGSELYEAYNQIKQAFDQYFLNQKRGSLVRGSIPDEKNPEFNLEHLYEILQQINRPEQQYSLQFASNKNYPVKSRLTELLEYELKKYIQMRCIVQDADQVKYLKPLLSFTELTEKLHIISLNYDTCIETLCEKHGIKWTDGFSEQGWLPSLFNQPDFDLYLLKIHGSVTWQEKERGIYSRSLTKNLRQTPWKLGMARTLTQESSMIYPGIGKQLIGGPYLSLFNRFQELLDKAKLCIVIGYAFGDQHVSDIIFNACRRNADMKVVILNPDALPIAKRILWNVEPALQEKRFFVVSHKRMGYINEALDGNWLLERTKSWLRGQFDLEEQFDFKQEVQIEVKGRPKEKIPGITERLSGITIDAAGHIAYMASRDQPEIIRYDFVSGDIQRIAVTPNYVRGLAVDCEGEYLYAVANRYTPSAAEFLFKSLANKSGAGQVWKINLDKGTSKAVTHIHLLKSASNFIGSKLEKNPSLLWKDVEGVLRWPYSIIIEQSGKTALVTEARQLCRLDLASGKITTVLNIPLCFNLVSVAMEKEDSVLLVDGGVSGSSYSRLMRASLSGKVPIQYLIEGLPMSHVCILPGGNSVLITQGGAFPRGRIFEFDLVSKKEIGSWENLDSPTQIVIAPDGKSAYVTTEDGLLRIFINER